MQSHYSIIFTPVKPIGSHNYFVYITTNFNKKVLYIGVTNDLARRLFEHQEDARGPQKTFAGKYKCTYLIYFERHEWINHAIEREKELKGWIRQRKDKLITDFNPGWRFLNKDVVD